VFSVDSVAIMVSSSSWKIHQPGWNEAESGDDDWFRPFVPAPGLYGTGPQL